MCVAHTCDNNKIQYSKTSFLRLQMGHVETNTFYVVIVKVRSH